METRFSRRPKKNLRETFGSPACAKGKRRNWWNARRVEVRIELPGSRRAKCPSVFADDGTAPAEAVVDAEFDRVLVVLETGTHDGRRPSREGCRSEIVILILGLGRPVRREHVFETGADGVAVLLVACGCERHRRAGDAHADRVIVAPGETALGVKQRRAPGIANPAGDRA